MLQIRLNPKPSADPGGGAAKAPAEAAAAATEEEAAVTVACPEHFVLDGLPVAKSLGTVVGAAAAGGGGGGGGERPIGRLSRRLLGERVHICARCDFPIAIYGRLIPCEHAFCLTCARSGCSCFLCNERIQKVQSIKMMEGMFICAAPQCLKSFLDRTEFETHVHKTHSDLGQTNINKERCNEPDAFNIPQPSSTDIQKQNLVSESSTARAPLRSGFSLSSNSPVMDREDRIRCHQSGNQPRQNPNLLLNPPEFQANLPQQHSQHPRIDNQSGLLQPPLPLQAPFSGYLPLPPNQPPNFAVTVNTNQPLELGFAQPEGMPNMPLRSGLPFSASDYCSSVPESSSPNQRFPCKEIQGGFTEQSEGKGVPAPTPLQLHFPSQSLSPPLPPHLSMQPHFH